MSAPLSPGELVRLRDLVQAQQARLAAQEATTAGLRADVARLRRRRARPRRLVPLALVALLVALLPLSLLAAGPFGDLNAGSPHNGNIQAIADAGITKGCDPPAFVSYCPSGQVTREEMASFLARTAGLGGNPPVANALTAVSAQTAASATTAANAAQLGGQPASYYQAAGQPIANATNAAQLGGQPAANYIQRGAPDLGVLKSAGADGPLPKSFNVTVARTSRVLIFVSGSAYSVNLGNGPQIGVIVDVDGTVAGDLRLKPATAGAHLALVSTVVSIVLTPGSHTVGLTANMSTGFSTGTTSDDHYDVTVVALPIE